MQTVVQSQVIGRHPVAAGPDQDAPDRGAENDGHLVRTSHWPDQQRRLVPRKKQSN
jgi:hypothetical protein